MSEIDEFFRRANVLLDKLESILPAARHSGYPDVSPALRWQCRGNRSWLEPVHHISKAALDDLLCIDRQKDSIVQNTRQFIHGLPANNVLLWGPRGTGKSSLVKAILNEFMAADLRLIEVESQHLVDLQQICDLIYQQQKRFIIFCDDLSFADNDPGYKALKVILDGSVGSTPENVLIYATSNRRHLVPEYMSENQQAGIIEGELHLSDATEEKISLSERFGIWLAFHPFSQQQYLLIVDHWLRRLGASINDTGSMQQAALRWALQHGSRSGRIAWQFARDWTGKAGLQKAGGAATRD
jgi:hypothetical protein